MSVLLLMLMLDRNRNRATAVASDRDLAVCDAVLPAVVVGCVSASRGAESYNITCIEERLAVAHIYATALREISAG